MAVALSFRKILRESAISSAEQLIARWDPNSPHSAHAAVASIFLQSRDEARRFLLAVRDLQQAVEHPSSDQDSTGIHALDLMDVAMRRLRRELGELLLHYKPVGTCPVVSPSACPDASCTFRFYLSTDDQTDEDEEYSSDAAVLEYLRAVAECMITSGYGRECVETYTRSRRSVVHDGLLRLGVESLSVSQVHKLNWESLDFRVKRWKEASRPLFGEIFPEERRLCDYVFASFEATRDSCFGDVTRDAAVEYLRFPWVVASRSKTPPEKLLHLLDMYSSVRSLSPELGEMFSSKSTNTVQSQVDASLLRLSGAVRSMLADIESTVHRDASKSVPSGGGVHVLTVSVMNQLVPLAGHAETLAEILLEGGEEEEVCGGGAGCSVGTRFERLLTTLLCKLDVKAEAYRDPSQSYLFLVNNILYMVNMVRESKLADILGAEWVSTHESKARSFARGFLRVAWRRVVETVPENPSELPGAEARRDRMLRFNKLFEEVCRSQVGWVVLDGKIGNEIRMAVARSLVGRYRPFYERCRTEMTTGEGAPTSVRFAPEDLLNYLSGLYSASSGCSEWDWSSSGCSGGFGKTSIWRRLRESI